MTAAEQYHLLSHPQLTDRFISDVLLPSTTESQATRDIYDLFCQYCQHLEVAPSHIKAFSQHLRKRFQKRRVKGETHFYCILKPELTLT